MAKAREAASQLSESIREHNLTLVAAGVAFYAFLALVLTYGALASIVVVLLWLWLSSLVVLIGAEVDGRRR